MILSSITPALRRAAVLLLPGTLVVGALAAPAYAANPLDLTPPNASFGVVPGGPDAGDPSGDLDANEPVLFDASSSSDAETPPEQLLYRWDFGDGTTSGPTPSNSNVSTQHTYPAGVYTVTLTVTDSGGRTDTATQTLQIDDTAPVAAFTRTPSTAKVGQQVAFDASSSSDAETPDDALTYTWDFGDGSAGTGRTTTHTYATAGTKTVKLVVADPEGATATKQLNVTVTNTAPTANGTVTPSSPRVGQEATFDGTGSTDAETPSGLTYTWDFGDGTPTSSDKVAKHTYSAPSPLGGYQVTLTVTDPQGLKGTKTFTLDVGANQAPTAAAQASPSKANLNQVVTLTSTGSKDPEGGSLTYSWDLGGGEALGDNTAASTTTKWSTPGTKTVTLTVTDQVGKTGTATVQVLVGNTAPTARATATPNPARRLQVITFDGSGSTDPETPSSGLTYSWKFSDGTTTPYSTSPTTTHSWATTGTKTATLSVKDSLGTVGSQTISVVIVSNRAPTATATATPTEPTIGDTVTFDASRSSDPDGDSLTYRWDFPDGSSATTRTVKKSFPTLGAREVTLTVKDPYGVQGTDTVTVTVVNAAPTAKISVPSTTTPFGQALSFDGSGSTDKETPDQLTYAWDFGDGGTSTDAKPSHTWSTAGTYPVKLTVTDPDEASDTETVTITVTNEPPTAKISVPSTTTPFGQALAFDGSGSTDKETPDSLTYAWAFGDGGTSTDAKPSHTWTTTGTYPVTLTVKDPQGQSDTETVTITVTNDAPTAAISVPSTTTPFGKPLALDGSGSTDKETPDSLTYAWDFGDGGTSTDAKPSHTWTATGTYPVKLTVTDPQGLKDTETVTITVTNDAPTAVVSAPSRVARVGQTLSFDGSGSTDKETPDSLTYAWDFGDGTKASGAKVTHSWSQTGAYPVTLTVTDPQGLKDTETVTANVTNGEPAAVIEASRTVAEQGQAVDLDGTKSGDPDGGALTYSWDFDDGTTGTGSKVSHSWAAVGTYDVVLTVTDPQGLTGTTTRSITVSNSPPEAVATPASTSTGVTEAVELSGSGSSDPEGGALTYAWDFKDGTTGTGATVSHAWTTEGTYAVVLTVTDPRGNTDTATSTVTVTDGAPTVVLAGPSTATAGRSASYDATGSSDPESGTEGLTYAWTFGDGTTATGQQVTHTWTTGGTRTVTVTVTDPRGNSTSRSSRVSVFENVACEGSRVDRTGGWQVRSSAAAPGGKACTGPKDAALRMRFTGARFDLRFGSRQGGGAAKVLVDGEVVGKVSFDGSTRSVSWSRTRTFSGLGGGAHTVRLVVTRGPALVDGFRVLGHAR